MELHLLSEEILPLLALLDSAEHLTEPLRVLRTRLRNTQLNPPNSGAPWPTPSPSPTPMFENVSHPGDSEAVAQAMDDHLLAPGKRVRREELSDDDSLAQPLRRRPRVQGRPPCPRNGVSVWVPSALQRSAFSASLGTIFSAIITSSESLHSLDATNWSFQVASYLLESSSLVFSEIETSLRHRDMGLEGLVHVLNKKEQRNIGAQVVHMLDLIYLSVKVEVRRKQLKDISISHLAENLTQVFKKEGIITRTFQDWISQGKRFGALAAAGSPYILWMIAAQRKSYDFTKLHLQDIKSLCDLVQDPDYDTPFGKAMTDTVIPALVKLRSTHPIQLQNHFDGGFLLPEESTTLDFTDLATTQTVLERLKRNEFETRGRNLDAWALFLQPAKIQAASSDLYSLTAQMIGAVTHTPPSLIAAQEKVFGVIASTPARDCDLVEVAFEPTNITTQLAAERRKRLQTTEGERSKALNAHTIQDLEDLRHQLGVFYEKGHRNRTQGQYLYLPFQSIQPKGRPLLLRSMTGSLILLRGTLREDLKANLLVKLMAIFGQLKQRSSTCGDNDMPFSTLHFDWYNRYSTNGEDAPRQIHPEYLTKEGRKRANPSLFIPRPSEEIKRFPKEYEAFTDAFQEVFEDLRQQLQALLPEEYRIERIFAEFLPADEPSPVFPFSGAVVNLNVQTILHKDSMDKLMCLVLPIGDFQGGELCLLEPRLKLEVRHGDWIVFDSKDISHFNMPYVGARASFVLHSDKCGESWVEKRNGWKSHQSFSG